jgi:predicted nucleic acid-binding protein
MKKLKQSEEMLTVIIDTNVLLSSLIQRNYPFLVVDYVLMQTEIELCKKKQKLLHLKNFGN